MSYGYWKKGIHDKEASFNVFYRKNPFNSGYAQNCHPYQFSTPIIRAKKGVKEVNTPEVALSIFVWAIGYKKYGITLPTIPEINNIKKSFFLRSLKLFARKGSMCFKMRK